MNENGYPPPASAQAATEFLPVLNSGLRKCVCGADIPASRSADAKYCTHRCREVQARKRRTAGESQQASCVRCGDGIPRSRKYCADCREERRRERVRDLYAERQSWRPRLDGALSSGVVGAMAELLVSADLLARGYFVFRALSQACPCDLLILRDNLSARVEVRRVTRRNDGRLPTGCDADERGRFDVLARVEPDGSIHYTGLEKLDA